MNIGVIFPQTEFGNDPLAIRDYAQTAEELGYTHVVAFDHVLGANPHRPGGWPGAYTHEPAFYEPFVLFSYLAGLTKTLGLVPGVIILPQRQTALVAKQAATLDVLSGGRLRLGVGLGWNNIEYIALNEDFHSYRDVQEVVADRVSRRDRAQGQAAHAPEDPGEAVPQRPPSPAARPYRPHPQTDKGRSQRQGANSFDDGSGHEERLIPGAKSQRDGDAHVRDRAAGEKHEVDDEEREKDRLSTARSRPPSQRSLVSHLVRVVCHFILSLGDGRCSRSCQCLFWVGIAQPAPGLPVRLEDPLNAHPPG